MTVKPRTPRWETVPAGTPPSECRAAACRMPIYWIERPSVRDAARIVRVPVDCAVTDGYAPEAEMDGFGISHYETCLDPKQFTHPSRTRNHP